MVGYNAFYPGRIYSFIDRVSFNICKRREIRAEATVAGFQVSVSTAMVSVYTSNSVFIFTRNDIDPSAASYRMG